MKKGKKKKKSKFLTIGTTTDSSHNQYCHFHNKMCGNNWSLHPVFGNEQEKEEKMEDITTFIDKVGFEKEQRTKIIERLDIEGAVWCKETINRLSIHSKQKELDALAEEVPKSTTQSKTKDKRKREKEVLIVEQSSSDRSSKNTKRKAKDAPKSPRGRKAEKKEAATIEDIDPNIALAILIEMLNEELKKQNDQNLLPQSSQNLDREEADTQLQSTQTALTMLTDNDERMEEDGEEEGDGEENGKNNQFTTKSSNKRKMIQRKDNPPKKKTK